MMLGYGWLIVRTSHSPPLSQTSCREIWLIKVYRTYRDYQRLLAAVVAYVICGVMVCWRWMRMRLRL